MSRDKFLRANEQIRFSPVIVIDDSGTNLGSLPTKEAIDLAYSKGLDLVEIDPNSRPPICKIMDFGRYKYDLSKREKENKARSRQSELKEIRLTFKIGDHDIDYKAKQALSFFESGDKVKVSMRLRGRENALAETAYQVFERFLQKTGLAYERTPQRNGNQIVAMLTEKKLKKNS